LKDFEKFAGNPAKVKTTQPIGGQKNFSGRIVEVKGEEIVFEDRTNGMVQFPYNTVAKANLEVDFEEELNSNNSVDGNNNNSSDSSRSSRNSRSNSRQRTE
jgi:hypothetical protein